jgi:hypothetical protein
MNFDEYAAGFPNPERRIPCGEQTVGTQVGEVVVAGTILTTEKEFCCIDINGVHYEIASSDVIDIQVIPPTDSGKGADDTWKADDVPAKGAPAPQLVLIKLNGNAVLCRRTPVPAALVAAVGTWVSVVPPATQAAQRAGGENSAGQ